MSSENSVVFILRHFTVGGLERVVLTQVTLLLDQGFDVTVVVVHPGRDNALIGELDERARLVSLPASPVRRLAVLRRTTAGRVVLLHFGDGKLFITLRPALTAARSVIRFCHSDYAHLRNGLKNRVDRLLSRSEDRIVAVGGRSTRFLLDDVGVDRRKVDTLPNAIPPGPSGSSRPEGAVWRRHEGRDAAHLIVSVASFYPHKGHEMLLRGFAEILRHEPDSVLALVGDGSETIALWQTARDLGVLGRVRWLGAVWNREVVRGVLAEADVFVSMSRFEGIPISVLEAGEHHLPMVLTDIPGHRDGAGEHASYVAVDDYRSFADKVVETLRGGAADRRPVDSAAAWERYARHLVDTVREAGAGAGKVTR
jgi:glycosyltransferase involved in cell wall biosynthesis